MSEKSDCDVCGKFFNESELERCDGCGLMCCEECIEFPCENDHEEESG